MNSIKHDIINMHTELAEAHERVHKLIRVWELAESHKLDQMNHLQLLEKLAASRRTNDFHTSEALAERQHRTQGYMCSVDYPKHHQIDIYFNPRRSSPPHEYIESMWAEVNVLKQEIFLSQPPSQYDVPPRRSSARFARSPPQQPCSVSGMTTDMSTKNPEGDGRDKRGEILYIFS